MTTKIFNNQNLSKTSYSWSQYVLVIEFHRLALSQLLKTFIPTFLLCLLAFSTTLVDMERPGDRFMGAATMILVLATWINIINGELPKTCPRYYVVAQADVHFLFRAEDILSNCCGCRICLLGELHNIFMSNFLSS